VNVIAVAAGPSHTCAVRADGTAACWGSNSNGQLGDGTTIDRSTAASVTGLTNVVALAVGEFHTCALRSDGSVRCWGANFAGQLGDSTTTERHTPVAVSNLTTAVAIAVGQRHSCALKVNGAPSCWGNNGQGQIGDGTSTDRHSPVEVGSFRANVEPEATLASAGQRVLLTALVNCPDGDTVTIDMTLTQGAVAATGHTVDKCTGGLTEYPVQVVARRGERFDLGSALAEITAAVDARGQSVEIHEWSREVEIAATP
jgi:Regulator of Chromosome Condensation (RCC1) repeat protein